MDSTEETRIISFCTGYGGLEMGLHRVIPNLRTVCYVEIEAFACANLVSKIEQGEMDAAPIWTDLATFDGEPFQGKIHGIIGGYPCQPFSNAGKRQGKKDPRHLWPYIEQHIRTIRPLWCFFENVGGHLTLGFEEVFKSLRDMGYKVEAGLFTADQVGAPHKRERLFILAYSAEFGALREPGTVQQADGRSRGTLPRITEQPSQELANARSGRCDTGTDRTGRNKGTNADRSGARSKLENTKDTDRGAGEQSIESGSGIRRRISANAGSNMGNPNSQHRRSHTEGRDDETETRSASEEMAQPNSDGRSGILRETRQRQNRAQQWKDPDGQSVGDGKPRAPRKQLANTTSIGTQGHEPAGCDQPEGSIDELRYDRWPARPGQKQYSFEEPRTVKSGMGRTVNGFASRVDELRLLGNGVVPQCAELAFRTLLEMINND